MRFAAIAVLALRCYGTGEYPGVEVERDPSPECGAPPARPPDDPCPPGYAPEWRCEVVDPSAPKAQWAASWHPACIP